MNRLIWFRNDIRTIDNKAFFYACNNENIRIFAIFIAPIKQWEKHNLSKYQIYFIYENVLKLKKALFKLGIKLTLKKCSDFISMLKCIKNFCEKNKIKEIFYNKQYELNELKRDEKLRNFLGNRIKINSFDDNVILPPGSVLNKKKEMYKIFTPFRKEFINQLNINIKDIESLPVPKIRKYKSFQTNINIEKNPYCNFQLKEKRFFSGEKNAIKMLSYFCEKKIKNYSKNRNIPSINGTSLLSPYLAIGVISPRQCFNTLKNKYNNFLEKKNDAFFWLNEIIWREFYRHLISAYPFICKNEPFIEWTKKIKWINDKKMILAWKKGLTGYPIVDAGMRQLNKIGWMHNRLRMITASFLVKDLLTDWRIGESYFMSKLLDGDFASNNGGWQWVASTGTDSVPYYRIFNPILQSQRIDPKGIFIRYWIPELKEVPNKYIHNPYLWSKNYHKIINYPLPIIDHSETRKRTLYIFNNAKEKSKFF